MDQPDDGGGGRSGIFPRVDLHAPPPADADSPAPRRRPTPTETQPMVGEAPPAAEGEDQMRDETEDPTADAPAAP
jgi:hypothetical protein